MTTRGHVNLAVQATESPKPHTVDVLSSLMVEAMTVCPGGEPWVARTFDLRDAYRQCAVAPGSSQFACLLSLLGVSNLCTVSLG